MISLTPKEIVEELNRFIVGQIEAKKAVAVAIRNRWRRLQLSAELTRRDLSEKHSYDRAYGSGKNRNITAPS